MNTQGEKEQWKRFKKSLVDKDAAKKTRLLRSIYKSFPVKINLGLAVKQHKQYCKIPHDRLKDAIDCMTKRLFIFATEWMSR